MKNIYSVEMDKWLKENFPLHSISATLNLFNKKFETNKTITALKSHCNKTLKIQSSKFYSDKEQEWLMTNYKKFNKVESLTKAFNKHFSTNKTITALNCFLSKHNCFVQLYQQDENEWLIANSYKYYYPELTRLFNEKFGRNKSESSVRTHCERWLKVYSKSANHYTKEQIEWIRENYPKDESRQEFQKRYIEKFNEYRSIESLKCKALCLGVQKDAHQFKKGNKTWNKGMSKNEFKNHFSDESYVNMVKHLEDSNPSRIARKKLNVSKDESVTEIENGVYAVISKKLRKRLSYHHLLNKGELTLAAIDVYKVKMKLEDQSDELKM